MMNIQNETLMSNEEKIDFSKQNVGKNLPKLRGGITIEQFQGMVTTLSAVKETEEASYRCGKYENKHWEEVVKLTDEQSFKLIDILYRAKYIDNLMDMSIQEVFQISKEKLELY